MLFFRDTFMLLTAYARSVNYKDTRISEPGKALSQRVLSPKLRENSCVLPANWSDKNRSTKCLHVSALTVSAVLHVAKLPARFAGAAEVRLSWARRRPVPARDISQTYR